MAFCERMQLELPDAFPLVTWEAFLTAGSALTDKGDASRGEFVGAAVAVVHHYRACDDARASMCEAWDQGGGQLDSEGLYAQQSDLFVFFTRGVAAIESTYYACYVMAARRDSVALSFSEAERRRAPDPKNFSSMLRSVPTAHDLINVAVALQKTPEWKDWNDFRNSLAHRTLPPHHARASLGGPVPPRKMLSYAARWSTKEIWDDVDYLEDKLVWLASQLESLMREGAKL